jgi:FixJ family two-component response regulator
LQKNLTKCENDSKRAELRVHSLYAKLTPREPEVMALVVRGLLNKQVGGELGLAEIAVKANRGQVMRKVDAASFEDLVNMAAHLGVAPPSKR